MNLYQITILLHGAEVRGGFIRLSLDIIAKNERAAYRKAEKTLPHSKRYLIFNQMNRTIKVLEYNLFQ